MKKMLSILLTVLLSLSLAACGENASAPPSQDTPAAQTPSLKERLVPDFDTGNPEFFVYLMDGENKRSLTEEPIAWEVSNSSQAIVMLRDDMALLGYTYLYQDGQEHAQQIDLPFSWIFSACVSPDKKKIAYYAKEDVGDSIDLQVAVYDIEKKELSKVKSFAPEDYAEIPFLTPVVDWGNNDTLYFDSPVQNNPAIEVHTFSDGKTALFAEDASWCQVSDDNTVITYIQEKSYGADENRKLLIKTGTAQKEFPHKHPFVKISPQNKIYLVDYLNAKILRLADDLSVEEEKSIEGTINWCGFEGETLQYSCLIEGAQGRIEQINEF